MNAKNNFINRSTVILGFSNLNLERMYKRLWLVLLVIVFAFINTGKAQSTTKKKKERKNEFYFSWGYNKEWYTHSSVHVVQPSLGNDYTFSNVTAHDHIGWDKGLLSIPLSIPQYNYRIGIYNKEKNIGFEINFDHTKYIIADQQVHIVGTLNNRHIDSTVHFNDNITVNTSSQFYYYLNNGANFLLFNVVKKWHLIKPKNDKFKLDLLGKVGVGPLVPHVENCLFGIKNDPHFQIGGWNVGAEGAVRATFGKHLFVEFCNKVDYASYSGLKIYQGTASQSFGTYELILNLGFVFPAGKHIN